MPEHIDMAPVDTLDVDIVNTLLAVELVDIVPVDTLAIDIVNTLLVAEYIEPVAGNAFVPVAVDIHIGLAVYIQNIFVAVLVLQD